MNFNKNNNNDIIDAEFVVEEKQKSFTGHSFAGGINNKKGQILAKPNFLTLLLLSPIILVFLCLAVVVFLIIFILFMPKILRLIKQRGQIFQNQSEMFRNIFNRRQ